MGMFDYIDCKYPLPDAPNGWSGFQTKSFGDGFVGGYMDNYTITKEGGLVLHKVKYEFVEEKDRPYYGTPDWDENPIFKMIGSIKSTPVGDEAIDHHGYINIYDYATGSGGVWFEYDIKFTDGKVTDVKRINRELDDE